MTETPHSSRVHQTENENQMEIHLFIVYLHSFREKKDIAARLLMETFRNETMAL